MLDDGGKHGYTEMITPYMVNEQSMYGIISISNSADVFQINRRTQFNINPNSGKFHLTNYYA